MALLDFTRAPSRSVAADRFHGLFGTLVGAMAAWNDTRRTRSSLARLSDHELHDIGLTRGDIDTVATGRRA